MLLDEKGFDYVEGFEIAGVHTEFVVQKFVNKILIIITQFGKIGNFYSIKNSVFSEENMLTDQGTKIFDIQQRFGASSIETEGALRYLMNFIGTSPLEILICLAMKDPEEISKEALDEVKEILMKLPIFAK